LNGHHEWRKELFHSRFKSYEETTRHHVEKRRLGQERLPCSLHVGFD
jgi:hypothetical protein